jgi:hypothetical protein
VQNDKSKSWRLVGVQRYRFEGGRLRERLPDPLRGLRPGRLSHLVLSLGASRATMKSQYKCQRSVVGIRDLWDAERNLNKNYKVIFVIPAQAGIGTSSLEA